MQVALKKKTEEVDDLPVEDAAEPSDRERELELEAAELRGENKALKKLSGGSSSGQPNTWEVQKAAIYNDMNALSDEDFKKKYNSTKHAATLSVTDFDNKQTKTESKRERAEASAIVSLGAKFGDFGKFQDEILEGVADLSDEARQDPARLKKFMEKQYLALSRDEEKAAPKKEASDSRRKVVADFEKPTPKVDEEEVAPLDAIADELKDEIPENSDISDAKLGRFMNLTSTKEQKELVSRWKPGTEKNETVAFIDMDLTCADPLAKEKITYRDPRKGFERVKVGA